MVSTVPPCRSGTRKLSLKQVSRSFISITAVTLKAFEAVKLGNFTSCSVMDAENSGARNSSMVFVNQVKDATIVVKNIVVAIIIGFIGVK